MTVGRSHAGFSGDVILKGTCPGDVTPNTTGYEAARKAFSWPDARAHLDGKIIHRALKARQVRARAPRPSSERSDP
ncbi:MAG TPA: hypothetical protein VFP54_01730 [Acidimicrobiales bacterium]|nr:hypothetical protein [Acidimicrobiales bacterium]